MSWAFSSAKIVASGQAATAVVAKTLDQLLAIPTGRKVDQVVIQNDPGSGANNILVGAAGGEVIVLAAGQSITLPVRDVSTISVKASANTPNANIVYAGE